MQGLLVSFRCPRATWRQHWDILSANVPGHYARMHWQASPQPDTLPPCCRLLERHPSSRLPAAVDCYERGVSLSGMSKAFGMPGIRIGWLALHDDSLMRRLQRLHDYSTICSSAPSEVYYVRWCQCMLVSCCGWASYSNALIQWSVAGLPGAPCCQHARQEYSWDACFRAAHVAGGAEMESTQSGLS